MAPTEQHHRLDTGDWNGWGGMTPQMLEKILRHYGEFRAVYEAEGVEEITVEGGVTVNVHDVLQGIETLPERQKQAIKLMCLLNWREVDAANAMGLRRWTSPVSSYRRAGLQKLVDSHWTLRASCLVCGDLSYSRNEGQNWCHVPQIVLEGKRKVRRTWDHLPVIR